MPDSVPPVQPAPVPGPKTPANLNELLMKVGYAVALLALGALAHWLGVDCVPCWLGMVP